MKHDHHHCHHHSNNNIATLKISFFIILIFMVVEAVGGWITDSLALLSDAGHMLSDTIALGLAWLAFALAAKSADAQKTYGYKRAEVLVAALNGIALLVLSLVIVVEAVHRFFVPQPVAAKGMLAIAILGLLVNIFIARYMHRSGDTHENLNMRGAFWHVMGDLLGSIAAIITALSIMWFDWIWMDPIASIVVALLIVFSGWRVTRDAIHILMEGTPVGLDMENISTEISKIEHVKNVHDLHAWTITSGQHAVSCHIGVEENIRIQEAKSIQQTIQKILKKYGINHATIQIEALDQCAYHELFCTVNDK